MLSFHSGSARLVNTEYAASECLDLAFGGGTPPDDCGLILIHGTIGHDLPVLGAAVSRRVPGAIVLGASCSGIVGRERVGETLNEVALMAVCGPAEEYAVAGVREIHGHNAYEKGRELAEELQRKTPGARMAYLLCPGLDIANDLVIKAFEDVFDPGFTLFGGTSSGVRRGLVNAQYYDGRVDEHTAWAVTFADPSLQVATRATHGFVAYGRPMTVTKAQGNKILELDGYPAWQEYSRRLSLPPDTELSQMLAMGALAEKLPEDAAQEYGNTHILRVVTGRDPDGTIHYPVTCREGGELWLTKRDEELIFSEQRNSLEYLSKQLEGHVPVAVFQTDCFARGRFLFNKIMKEEIIAMMQTALSADGAVPPWLGMYGFGEYARLNGRNTYHNYTTALMVLYR